jgi:hypothetical protein
MRHQVYVIFEKSVEFHLTVDEGPAMAHDASRQWLDKQFVALECEPLRASGKVLTADKVLVVTQAAGPAMFADADWAAQYTAAVHGALSKPMIRVDVPAMAITY